MKKAMVIIAGISFFIRFPNLDELVKSHFSGHCEECNDESI